VGIGFGARDFEMMAEAEGLAAVDAQEGWLETKGAEGARLQLDLVRMPAVDLSGRRLAAASFRRCVLMGVDFSKTDLTLATLSYSDLRAARFASSNLSGADLRKAKIDGADFAEAIMNRAQYGKSGQSRPTNMTKVKGGAATIRVAQADGVILAGADLRQCLMNLIFLGGANRTGAPLPEKATQRASAIASAFAPDKGSVPVRPRAQQPTPAPAQASTPTPPAPTRAPAPAPQGTERVWGGARETVGA